MAAPAVSGAQFRLRAGDYHADVASVGATLRTLRHRGRDVVAPFAYDEMRPAMRGALLAPWPNRTADGRYEWDGIVHQLAVNEIDTLNAAHGLVAWLNFEPTRLTGDSVALTATIEPQPGYPWRVRVDAEFVLSAEGLQQEVVATNLSTTPAPYGIGGHPYLLAGDSGAEALNAWFLEVPGAAVLLVSEARLLPTELVDVGPPEHRRLDFRQPRRIGTTELNHAFTGLRRDDTGVAVVRVTDGHGGGAEIRWDERCPWVQVYTSDGLTGDEYRHALAVEPMSCPPDALNSARNLIRLQPEESAGAGWRIRAVAP